MAGRPTGQTDSPVSSTPSKTTRTEWHWRRQQTPFQEKNRPGLEDLGDALRGDTDYTFLLKLFAGCAVASYAIKYGELWFQQPFDANVYVALSFIFIPSLLNALKWYKRSQDPKFEGFF